MYDEANKKIIITCSVAFCETSKNVEDIECKHLEELSKSSPWKETSYEIIHSGGDPTYLASPLMDSHVAFIPQNQN